MKPPRRVLAAAVALAMAAPGPAFAASVAKVVVGPAALAPAFASPALGAPSIAAPSLMPSPAALTPSLLSAPTVVPAALKPVVPAAAKATLVVAAKHTAALTPKSGGAESKAVAAAAFEGAAEPRPAASEVAGNASAGAAALDRSQAAVRSIKSIPPLPPSRPAFAARVKKLWPAVVGVGLASAAAFLIHQFGSPAAGLIPFLGLLGTIGSGSATTVNKAFLAGIQRAAAPGTIVSYKTVSEIGAGLGLDADGSGKVFTDLLQEGHLAIRDNRDAVYFSFRARAESGAAGPENEANVLAADAVRLMNGAHSADHARAVAKADRAVAEYERIFKATGAPLPQYAEAKALRANAMLEFFTGMLRAHHDDLEGRPSLTPQLAARVTDAEVALTWLHTATFQAGKVPPMPEKVHRKLVALIGSLNPQGEDGRGAAGEVADGYIAALDLLEHFDPRDFLYEGPSGKKPVGSRQPSDQEIAAFTATLGANIEPGDTATPEALASAGRALGLDGDGIDARVFALAAQGQIQMRASGQVVYFDLREQALSDEDGLWDLHNEAVDAIKLSNSLDAAGHLRAVARLDAVLSKYFASGVKSRAIEQVSIALANAKLEAMTSALQARAPDDAVRKGLGLLSGVYYSAERSQRFGPGLALVLGQAATLAVLRGAAGEKGDLELARGAELTRRFIETMGAGAGSNQAPAGKTAAKDRTFDSADDFKAKLDVIGMPAAIQAVATREYESLSRLDAKDSEAQKIRTYLDWLTELPWSARTEDTADIAAARKILDADHAGLDSVKERVLEFLAIRKKTGSKKGAIIAFTGPPGTGKTSIASAIAAALGRKFVRLSLGGVHDESVLRGHGRTYVGSMPGEIMRQMKAAGTINPVMLMDEVDKIGRNGNKGDPTAALLEVLDPEQNNTFRDRYLDVPYDLSEVLFIVTSNDLAQIPAPLRDRMEIIEFDGYTTLEKIAIAEKHVVPQKHAQVGLKDGEASLTRGALRAIIEGYTMEAGVRGLREKIETVLRKISAWTETRNEPAPAIVEEKDVAKYLGVERFSARAVAQNGVGVATGLAVNAYGGSTLNVEVSKEPGTGQLILRKQFGDDIEDSAKNALKYVKLNAAKFGLQDFDFTKHDIDINITPAGKVDGPSAGGLMVTAIISALTGRPVAPGVAMTGEITMRGDILPIGGLKQKVMAAHRMGYAEVIFPAANQKDLEGIPKEVRDGIKLTPARTYDDIYPSAIVAAPPAS